MMIDKQTKVTKDVAGKKIIVVRDFDASVEQVWRAWTDRTLLDQWWAPKPWKAETSGMDFREGGTWFYSMVGPEGERHYNRADFMIIEENKRFIAKDAFCDEHGNPNHELPSLLWTSEFIKSGDITTVRVEISFETEDDINKILEMGFEEGFTMALGNLDELLAG